MSADFKDLRLQEGSMKKTIFGVGLIIAGCIGVALGNLE